MGNTLKRHPFSGLVHSAGELLHREREHLLPETLKGVTLKDHHCMYLACGLLQAQYIPAAQGHAAKRILGITTCPLLRLPLLRGSLDYIKIFQRPIAFSL